MHPIAPNEHLIETKICRHCGNGFNITNADEDYLEKLSPTIAGTRFPLPHPSMCPDCRKIQRLAWRNEKNIFKRKCDFSGKDIIAIYPPDSPFIIYDEDIWKSDVWDAKTYGKDFDFSRWFFEQFWELIQKVPLASRALMNPVNSDYCNAWTALKNCYLIFSANICEDDLYCVDIVSSNSCVDCFGIIDSENCYECMVATNCYNVEHSYNIKNCRDGKFLLSCDGCSDCYGCTNLTNAQFSLYNVSYSKEDYLKKLQELSILTLSEEKKQFKTFYEKIYTKKPLPNIGSENIIESENVFDSENVSYSRHIRWAQNIRYCQKMQIPTVALAMDYTGFWNMVERVYYCQQVGTHAMNVYFSTGVFGEVSNIFYSAFCRDGVHNCFGCTWLSSASYCILNKQYTKEEYETLVPRIIEHMIKLWEWWEFFPAILSPYGYDHSVCQIINPLTETEARSQGFSWSWYEPPFPKVEKTIQAHLLPDDITKVPDDILNWAIECEVTKKPFRIIKQELEFYRKHNLPIPHKHPDQRYIDRLPWYFNY